MSAAAHPPLTAHLNQHSGMGLHVNHQTINLSRDKVHLDAKVWEQLDRAVAHEVYRATVTRGFLPQHRIAHHGTTVDASTVNKTLGQQQISNIDETQSLFLVEMAIDFSLTTAQVHKENEQHNKQTAHHDTQTEAHELSTATHQEQHMSNDVHYGPAEEHGLSKGIHSSLHKSSAHFLDHVDHSMTSLVMLGTRVTNFICTAIEILHHCGKAGFPDPRTTKAGFPIFDNGTVTFNVVPGDGGLTGVAQDNPLPLAQVIPVHPTSTAGQPLAYGENLPSAILQAMVDLNVNGYPGPFACTLPLFMYADSFRLNQALVMPADRLFSLLHWYYTSPGLPQMPAPAFGGPDLTTIFPKLSLINTALLVQGIGMVISLGGHTAVHVNGLDPVIGFSQIDQGGNNIFRLRTRLANNISDSGAIRRLEFLGS